MGNSGLGRLPARLRWRKAVELLDESPEDTTAVVLATNKAPGPREKHRETDNPVRS